MIREWRVCLNYVQRNIFWGKGEYAHFFDTKVDLETRRVTHENPAGEGIIFYCPALLTSKNLFSLNKEELAKTVAESGLAIGCMEERKMHWPEERNIFKGWDQKKYPDAQAVQHIPTIWGSIEKYLLNRQLESRIVVLYPEEIFKDTPERKITTIVRPHLETILGAVESFSAYENRKAS
ncbi:hypothetical protein KY308_04550 [Candidatus Woesearchaeota archaeon]|nr:hypothetical protein [Candidatus Woesearchaeota archaeon]